MINYDDFKKLYLDSLCDPDKALYVMEHKYLDCFSGIDQEDAVYILRAIYNISLDGASAISQYLGGTNKASKVVGVSYGTLKKWETGECEPHKEKFMQMAYKAILEIEKERSKRQ